MGNQTAVVDTKDNRTTHMTATAIGLNKRIYYTSPYTGCEKVEGVLKNAL